MEFGYLSNRYVFRDNHPKILPRFITSVVDLPLAGLIIAKNTIHDQKIEKRSQKVAGHQVIRPAPIHRYYEASIHRSRAEKIKPTCVKKSTSYMHCFAIPSL